MDRFGAEFHLAVSKPRRAEFAPIDKLKNILSANLNSMRDEETYHAICDE
jgi:hypothetical protein